VVGVLEAELRRVAYRAMVTAAGCMETRIRNHAPIASGQLRRSITASSVTESADAVSFTVTQSAAAAPHGCIINQATGRAIVPVRARALRFDVAGQTVFTRQVIQSTAHVGWWDLGLFDQWFSICIQGGDL
jgi:hypothetical protein